MSIELIVPPASEPVSLAEAKRFLRVDHGEEDSLILNLIAAARGHVESFTGRKCVTRRVIERRDSWALKPDGYGDLAYTPLVSVHAVMVFDSSAASHSIALENMEFDKQEGRFRFIPGPAPQVGALFNGVSIEYSAGFGDASAVPEDLRHAILVETAKLYEQRDLTDGVAPVTAALAAPYRRVRL